MRIDLHTHSSVSDGTQSPPELIRAAAAAGLDVVALTDHDTTAGWAAAQSTADAVGIRLITGMEVSTKLANTSVHVLSYLHDPLAPELAATIRLACGSRVTRARKFVENLAADFDICWAEVLAQVAPGATIGRPHIADALVAKGYANDRATAFATILHREGPYYVPYSVITPQEAIAQIRHAGGIPVIAHPMARLRGHTLDEESLLSFVAAGLLGLEIEHRDNAPPDREWLRAFAARHQLFVTGSSDFHGLGKPNMLGENLTHPDDFSELLSHAALRL